MNHASDFVKTCMGNNLRKIRALFDIIFSSILSCLRFFMCTPSIMIHASDHFAVNVQWQMWGMLKSLVLTAFFILFYIVYLCLFADVITIDKTNENFRLIYDVKGRFTIHRITADEAKVKSSNFFFFHIFSVWPHCQYIDLKFCFSVQAVQGEACLSRA